MITKVPSTTGNPVFSVWSLLLLVFVLSACDVIEDQPPLPLSSEASYFQQIAIGGEYGNSGEGIMKWMQPVDVYIMGETSFKREHHVSDVLEELSELINLPMRITADPARAEITMLFGTGEEYAKLEPNAAPYTQDSYGLFWLYRDANFHLEKGTIWIDTEHSSWEDQQHTIREELTQALGLINDSYSYEASVFYQDYSTSNAFLDIDKAIISMLYDDRIIPGMAGAALIDALQEIESAKAAPEASL